MRSNIFKTRIALLFFAFVLGFNNVDAKEIIFSNVNVEEALKKASSEGKLVFLDFYANWCTPCKYMEKTTFQDDRVVELLKDNFIAVKVDIDNVEGFQMKNKYEVSYLPTMLILNSYGQMVERIEQTMVADDLLSILSIHNSPENKIRIKHDFNKSPKRINGGEEIQEEDPWTISPDDYRRYAEIEEKRNYRVQVGIYSEYQDAQEQVDYLRGIFIEPIIVLNDFRDDQVTFKIMLGQFSSSSEASSFCKILKTNFGIDAIVN